MKSKIEQTLPRFITPYIEHPDPNRDQLLMDKAEPMNVQSKLLNPLDNVDVPYTDNVLPIRIIDLIDIDDPICSKSKVDREDPILPSP